MTDRIIECVPNFSEGRDAARIGQIAQAITSVDGVRLLNVDSGAAANRTVMTFAGEPGSVAEAAFRAVMKAAEVIDMGCHCGEHPRIGATDVCPIVPVRGVTMEECVEYARALARRVGESGIPVYCYENAAFVPERRNLAACRSGEYEGIRKKIADERWKPDFGPSEYNDRIRRSGISVIGARKYLVAINFNLDTDSAGIASEIARDVREIGRKIVENGCERWQRGTLKGCKAIGWYIKEYGIAQVSMNVTDIDVTPVHAAYEEVCRCARKRGVRVTGSELIGLVPGRVLLEAGIFYAERESQNAAGLNESELMELAVKSMGLADLRPFDYKKRVIEYLL
ncbi:MAG: glutamate formimidoyltransferase [Bacteroidetes bacterium]|uniref:glutamate formimidoyltransferase n=1 Tax=Candidatus Egerieousia excrementavium TaxID=2840778 RepID=A0A9D9GVI7_9BACT|nr:glutamate formimidoyltransferase [Candidatus Egerieousia excrementavium]